MTETFFMKLFSNPSDWILSGVILYLTFHNEKRLDRKEESFKEELSKKDVIIQNTHRVCEEKLEKIATDAVDAIKDFINSHRELLEKIKGIENYILMRK